DLRLPLRRHAAPGPRPLRKRVAATRLPAEPGALRRRAVDPDRCWRAGLPVPDTTQGAGSRGRDDIHRDAGRGGSPALMETGGAVLHRMIVGGEEAEAAGGETFTTASPASGATLAQ